MAGGQPITYREGVPHSLRFSKGALLALSHSRALIYRKGSLFSTPDAAAFALKAAVFDLSPALSPPPPAIFPIFY